MLIFGKIENLKQIIISFFRRKNLVSINNELKFGFIQNVLNIKEIKPYVFEIDLQIFTHDSKFEYINTTLSFDPKTDGDEVVICASFNDLFPSYDENMNKDDIVDIKDFAKQVECNFIGDNDGHGYIVTHNFSIFNQHGLRTQELASLQHHPDVLGILWFNK